MKKIMLLLAVLGISMSISAQTILTGHVYEMFEGKKSIAIGVNISVNNSQNRMIEGTVTNYNGEFSLRIPEGKGQLTLVFSYIGMKTQSIPYTGQTSLEVVMSEDAQALSDVVVSARREYKSEMGITMREQTAATERIQMNDIVAFAPVTSVEEALQGRLAGVDILTGGDPGARSSIRIRGTATLNTSADPLIVINGVPYSTDIDDSFDFSTANNDDYAAMLNLSPYDTESIEVLKDDPHKSYDYIANNYHRMSKMELCDIIKELIYGMENWVMDMEQDSVWRSVIDELQDQYMEAN
jgi:hypothetical protein